MSFFDKIGEKISQTSQSAAQKTRNTAETIRLKGLVSEEKKRINSAQLEIGKIYYEAYYESAQPPFQEFVNSIKESEVKIEAYTEQIKQLKGVLKCVSCGGENPHDAPFCSSCGIAIETENTVISAENSSKSQCRSCGNQLAENVAFCTSCGTKVATASEVEIITELDAEMKNPICLGCEEEMEPDDSFCLNCGQKVD